MLSKSLADCAHALSPASCAAAGTSGRSMYGFGSLPC